MIDERILKESDRLMDCQRKIIQDLLDKGFSHKETDYSIGYIRGIEYMLNIFFNLNRLDKPIF